MLGYGMGAWGPAECLPRSGPHPPTVPKAFALRARDAEETQARRGWSAGAASCVRHSAPCALHRCSAHDYTSTSVVSAHSRHGANAQSAPEPAWRFATAAKGDSACGEAANGA